MTTTSTARVPHPRPPELPANIDHWERQIQAERTLNDLVEDIHRALVENDQYRRFLYATYDEQAEEGSLAADNIEAARMIREKARSNGNAEVSRQKLATLVKALGVVLRRYGNSRKDRRNRLGGETIPGDNGD